MDSILTALGLPLYAQLVVFSLTQHTKHALAQVLGELVLLLMVTGPKFILNRLVFRLQNHI